MNIAQTIYEQIGGRTFRVMTGSRDFINMGNALRMTLVPNRSKANRLDIIYNEGSDLYTMRFYRHTRAILNINTGAFRDASDETIEEFTDVFNDQLSELFREVTGLDTIMPRFEAYTGQDK